MELQPFIRYISLLTLSAANSIYVAQRFTDIIHIWQIGIPFLVRVRASLYQKPVDVADPVTCCLSWQQDRAGCLAVTISSSMVVAGCPGQYSSGSCNHGKLSRRQAHNRHVCARRRYQFLAFQTFNSISAYIILLHECIIPMCMHKLVISVPLQKNNF